MNKKKVKITTQVDSDVKDIFDSFQHFHHIGYQEALDFGIRHYLKSINNINIVRNELIDNANEREQLKDLEAKFEELDRVLSKPDMKKIPKENELEKERLEALKSLLKKPYSSWTAPNRSHAKAVGKFKTKEELKKWVTEKQ